MRRSNVALRLQTSLLEEAKRVTESEGVALNRFNVVVAEKVSALRTESYFRRVPDGRVLKRQRESSSVLDAIVRRFRGTRSNVFGRPGWSRFFGSETGRRSPNLTCQEDLCDINLMDSC